MYFGYGLGEINYLKERDSQLASLIDEIGHIKREVDPDPLSSLLETVISQQITKQAANTVINRFRKLTNDYDYNILTNLEKEDIKACGMSYRKAEYLYLLIEAIDNKKIDLTELPKLSNEEVISEITKLKGFGLWSAQMFLIFCLQRKDIIAYDDLMIRKGIMKLYGLESLSKAEFNEYKKRYGECASIASLYLWELSHK